MRSDRRPGASSAVEAARAADHRACGAEPEVATSRGTIPATTTTFEGSRYLKCVDAHALPSARVDSGEISHDRRPARGTSHSFVQVVRPGRPHRVHESSTRGRTAFTGFDRYIAVFASITVGSSSTFRARASTLDLATATGVRLRRAELGFGAACRSAWRAVSATTPGIMGPYRFVPRMEGYHGICSFDRAARACGLTVPGSLLLLGGRGYAREATSRAGGRARSSSAMGA